MNKNSIFVLGLIGSILGILASFFWLFFGTFFMSAFIAGFMEELTQENVPMTAGNMVPGLSIALVQSGITIAAFIITLVKTTPSSLRKGVKNSGVWTLVLGIVTFVVNPLHITSSVLLVIAAIFAMNSVDGENESNHRSGTDLAATTADESITLENDQEPE